MKTKRKAAVRGTGFHTTNIDISNRQYKALKAISVATRLPLAVQIRTAIDAYLEKQQAVAK